jgi:hypothetical protein
LESFDFVDLKKNYSVFGDFENHWIWKVKFPKFCNSVKCSRKTKGCNKEGYWCIPLACCRWYGYDFGAQCKIWCVEELRLNLRMKYVQSLLYLCT